MVVLGTLSFLISALFFGPLLLLWRLPTRGTDSATTRRTQHPARGIAAGQVEAAATGSADSAAETRC